jgi:HSP20 family protein
MRVLNRMARRGWDPWKEIAEFRTDVSRLFNEMGIVAPTVGTRGPAINLYSNAQGLLLTAELPGVDPESLSVTVANDAVTFQGERPAPVEQAAAAPEGQAMTAEKRFRRQERPFGIVSRTVQLPYAVDADQSVAKYEHGVLSIRLPRPEQARPRKIAIES